jgi:hypothetical protein
LDVTLASLAMPLGMTNEMPLDETGTPLGVGVDAGAAAVRACMVPATRVSTLCESEGGGVVAGTPIPQAKTASIRTIRRGRVLFIIFTG